MCGLWQACQKQILQHRGEILYMWVSKAQPTVKLSTLNISGYNSLLYYSFLCYAVVLGRTIVTLLFLTAVWIRQPRPLPVCDAVNHDIRCLPLLFLPGVWPCTLISSKLLSFLFQFLYLTNFLLTCARKPFSSGTFTALLTNWVVLRGSWRTVNHTTEPLLQNQTVEIP